MQYLWEEEEYEELAKQIRQIVEEKVERNDGVFPNGAILTSKAHDLIKEASVSFMVYALNTKSTEKTVGLLAKAFVYLESFAAIYNLNHKDVEDEIVNKYSCTSNYLKHILCIGDLTGEQFFSAVEKEIEEMRKSEENGVKSSIEEIANQDRESSTDEMLGCLNELDDLLSRADKDRTDYFAKLKRWDSRFLDLAKLVSSWSKDPSSKVGAVIVDEKNRVVSLGFNGLPMGVEDTDERLNNRELKYDLIVHAEQNAILCSPQSVDGCRIYVYPYLPCSRCAGAIIQSRIKEVVVEDLPIPERWEKNFNLAKEILREAGVSVRQIKGNKNG